MNDWGDMTISEAVGRLVHAIKGTIVPVVFYACVTALCLFNGFAFTFSHQWWLATLEALLFLANGRLTLHFMRCRQERKAHGWTHKS